MKPLPTTLKIKGFTHTQLAREGNTALFSQRKGAIEAFEVIKVASHNGFPIPGTDRRAEPGESYPPASQWGKSGWTFTDRERAWEKYGELAVSTGIVAQSGGIR